MRDSTPSQLRFTAIAGFIVHADFEGGALSSDFGPLLLRGVEQQCGLIGHLAGATHDGRHPSYIEHSVADPLRQRIYQSACGYVDGNGANSLIHSRHENTLCHTELARAQPMSIILKPFNLAVRGVQYKDRGKLHLPSACPVKGLLHRVSKLLYLAHSPAPG